MGKPQQYRKTQRLTAQRNKKYNISEQLKCLLKFNVTCVLLNQCLNNTHTKNEKVIVLDFNFYDLNKHYRTRDLLN